MKIFPSKRQWSDWTLTSKASYIGVWIAYVGIVLAIIIFLVQATQSNNSGRPMISILTVDTHLEDKSMKTKFTIKNVGDKPAFILIKAEASIDGKPIQIANKDSENHYQTIMPSQKIRYRGLTIKEAVLNLILDGKLHPAIVQNINITYGSTKKTIGEYRTFQSVKLDIKKLVKFTRGSMQSTGIWQLKSSDSK